MIEFSEKDTQIILKALYNYKNNNLKYTEIESIDKLISRIENNNIDRHIRNIWRAMLDRCKNENNIAFNSYGGRGIKVCDEWVHLKNFTQWCYKNNYKIGLSIDRIDVNGNYEPNNCRLATQKEQQRNRRNNRILIDPFDGKKLCIAAIAEKYNMSISCLSDRINTRKISLKEAIEKPIRKVSKITDENNNKITICDKIIIWHDTNLAENEEYTIQRMSDELNIKVTSIRTAIAPTHNQYISNLLETELYKKNCRSPRIYRKINNWKKDVVKE